jgi:hypothetical protein
VATFNLSAKVVGVDQVRKNLTRLDSDLGKALTKEVRETGNELRDEARGLIPSGPPLSNWAGTGRAMPSRLPYWEGSGAAKSGIKTLVGAGSRQRGTYKKGAALRVQSSNAAAAVFDKVGDSSGSSTFVANMVNKHGPKRRALLKAADNSRDALRKKVEQAVERAVANFRRA